LTGDVGRGCGDASRALLFCRYPVDFKTNIGPRAWFRSHASSMDEGQQAIGGYQVNGERLFNPSADAPK
jgi:hypothetical protein